MRRALLALALALTLPARRWPSRARRSSAAARSTPPRCCSPGATPTRSPRARPCTGRSKLAKGQVLRVRATVDTSEDRDRLARQRLPRRDREPRLHPRPLHPAARAGQRRERMARRRGRASKATLRRCEDRRGGHAARAGLRADPRLGLQPRQVPRARRMVHLAQRRRLRQLPGRDPGGAADRPRGERRGRGRAVLGGLRVQARRTHAGAHELPPPCRRRRCSAATRTRATRR